MRKMWENETHLSPLWGLCCKVGILSRSAQNLLRNFRTPNGSNWAKFPEQILSRSTQKDQIWTDLTRSRSDQILSRIWAFLTRFWPDSEQNQNNCQFLQFIACYHWFTKISGQGRVWTLDLTHMKQQYNHFTNSAFEIPIQSTIHV